MAELACYRCLSGSLPSQSERNVPRGVGHFQGRRTPNPKNAASLPELFVSLKISKSNARFAGCVGPGKRRGTFLAPRRTALARSSSEPVSAEVEESYDQNASVISPTSSNGSLEHSTSNGNTPASVEEQQRKNNYNFKPYDYGFRSSFLSETPTVPSNVFKLSFQNFGREYAALRRNYLFEELGEIETKSTQRSGFGKILAYSGRFAILTIRFLDKLLTLYDGLPEIKPLPKEDGSDELYDQLKKLTLSNDAVWERERNRPQVEAPLGILVPYYFLCWMLDFIFDNRPIQRFWFLETVARMPYFSYISMLHLYETLGWWRSGFEVRKVHFAEEWNEMHHLKIMEAMGGDRLWVDRFFAQHAAFFYYWILNFMFLISPKVAYNFSELIEFHAVDTYGTFVDENEELLKKLPPPPIALSYYRGEDLYMFDEFQTSQLPEARRPQIESLYDVFCAIRDDEYEHVKTMIACQKLNEQVVSPNRLKSKQRQQKQEREQKQKLEQGQ